MGGAGTVRRSQGTPARTGGALLERSCNRIVKESERSDTTVEPATRHSKLSRSIDRSRSRPSALTSAWRIGDGFGDFKRAARVGRGASFARGFRERALFLFPAPLRVVAATCYALALVGFAPLPARRGRLGDQLRRRAGEQGDARRKQR
jgi:hypothetical protein